MIYRVSFNVYKDSGFEADVSLDVNANSEGGARTLTTRQYINDGFCVRNMCVEKLKERN